MVDKVSVFVNKILAVNDIHNKSLTHAVTAEEINEIMKLCMPVVMAQPFMLQIKAPISICGDIHGQYTDLLRIFNRCGYPHETSYLFLGDYVDRGNQQLEVICLLMGYKILYPENFFILRGNHETASINRTYGFYDECKRRYSTKLYNLFQRFFNMLPICALVGNRIFALHGGLSPKLKSWSQLVDFKYGRPYDPSYGSMAMDLLWSDPYDGAKDWAKNNRGIGYTFSVKVVKEFCETMDIDLIVRAHQVVQDGYQFFANQKLVTVFSAPMYCGEFDNSAGVMEVAGDLTCSFQQLKPKIRGPSVKAPLRKWTSGKSAEEVDGPHANRSFQY